MRIHVKAYPPFQHLAGGRLTEMDLPPESKVRDLIARLDLPSRLGFDVGTATDEEVYRHVMIHRGYDLLKLCDDLAEGDELSLMPPISGGAPAPTGTPSLTERMVDFVLDLVWSRAGLGHADLAKTYFLDWLGSAAAGTATAPGRILLDWGRDHPGAGCEVVGGTGEMPAGDAAFVNGALSHIVEMDDLDRASVLHPGCVVFPAALAAAEAAGASGRDFLAAAVAGYEVAIRVGEAVGSSHYRYWHNTATCGVFGAAVAAGLLFGAGRDQLVWALGNAGSVAGGLWQFIEDEGMTKHWHAGQAARCGVTAAELGRKGFSGPRRILEGKRGLFAAMSSDAVPESLVAGLDSGPWTPRMQGVSLKPYPSCRHTHPAVDAAMILAGKIGESTEAITGIRIGTYPAALAIAGNPNPQSPFAAKFSLQYCTACALAKRKLGLAEFTETALGHPEVHRLMQITECVPLERFAKMYPRSWGAEVRLFAKDGTELAESVDAARGDPENPMSPAEVEAKFRYLLDGTAICDRTGELIAKCQTLNTVKNMRAFLRA